MSATAAPIRVLLAVPTPPPFSGPEINGALLLAHGLGPGFSAARLDPSVRSSNRGKGRVSARTLIALARLWVTVIVKALSFRPQVLYLYLAQNRTGFGRDALVLLTARALGARVVAHVRGGNFENFYRHASPLEAAMIRLTLRRVARLVVVAERFSSQFAALVPAGSIRVLYNGIDDEMLAALAAARTAAPSTCTLLYMGHLSTAKGFGDLLQALPAVLEACPTLRLRVAGEWLEDERNIHFDERGRPLPSQLKGEAEWRALQARYAARLQYLGVLEGSAKIEALREADLLVLPSYSEGFPMAVLEAMAAGLALVVTPVGALPEILEDGVHARFVPIGDVAALGRAVTQLASDPAARRAMGARNRALVEQKFRFATVSAELETILRDAYTSSQLRADS